MIFLFIKNHDLESVFQLDHVDEKLGKIYNYSYFDASSSTFSSCHQDIFLG